jgi:hypothetical protein
MKTILTFLMSLFLGLSIAQTPAVGDFKSVLDGQWGDKINWQTYIEPAPPTPGFWVPANTPPPAIISGTIQVFINNDITLEGATTSVTIGSTAKLIINSGSLTVTSSGSITNNGTLTNSVGNSGLILESDASGTASLLSSSNISGTVERYMVANTWKMFGPGTSGSTSTDVTGAYLQTYDEANDAWNYIESLGVPLSQGVGYAYQKTSTATVSFSGTIQNADLVMSNLGAFGGDATGAAVVSNPFPTAVSWDASGDWSLSNIQSSIYYYTGTQWQNVGSSVTIPAQKGFAVVATNASNSFKFPASKKVISGTAFKSEDKADAFSLLLSITDDIEKTDDRFYLNYNEDATSNYDLMHDGILLRQGESCGNLFAKTLDNKDVSVLGEPLPEGVKTYPLYFLKGEADNYTIRVQDFVMDESKELTLNDLLTGASVVLTNDVEYQFVSSEEDVIQRFSLTVRDANGVEDEVNFSNLNIWTSNSDIVIENKTNEIYTVMIYDIAGRLLYEKQDINLAVNRIGMDDKTNVLVVKLISKDRVISKTIIK